MNDQETISLKYTMRTPDCYGNRYRPTKQPTKPTKKKKRFHIAYFVRRRQSEKKEDRSDLNIQI